MKKLIAALMILAAMTTEAYAGTMYREKLVQPDYPTPDHELLTDASVHEAYFADSFEIYARAWGYKTIDEYSESEKVKLYSNDKTLIVPWFMKETYLNLGWKDAEQIMLYTLDGREEVFSADEVEAQCAVGWYKEKPMLLYTLDGREEYFLQSDADMQCEVGWYRQRPVTLYTEDGRSEVFPADKVSEQRAVGWYYKSDLDRLKNLRSLAANFYVGQRVWRDKWNVYYPIGRVVAVGDTAVTVVWDTFYTYEWDRVYSQTGIKNAERVMGITLGERYTYDADEISVYK